MHTVYVLVNPEGRRYIGSTSRAVLERIKEHNNTDGKKRGWTRLRGPWTLLHAEEFENKRDALLREKELKTGKGRDFLDALMRGSPSLSARGGRRTLPG